MEQLTDGRAPVARITVILLLRNNRVYLEWFLDAMEKLEKRHSNTEFSYAFYENNSTDTTVRLLNKFVNAPVRKNRALLISEKLKDAPTGFSAEDGYHRPKYLGKLRNSFLKRLRPLESDWTWLLDTDIYFPPNVLECMFACQPANNNIAMVTCYTKEVSKVEGQGFECRNHYYDTYSVVDTEDRFFYPLCRFAECARCAEQRALAKVPAIDPKMAVIDVRSAYGGCVLVPSAILNDPIVEWRTTEVCFGELAMCEHVFFCDTIRIASKGGRVVILQNIRDLYWRK